MFTDHVGVEIDRSAGATRVQAQERHANVNDTVHGGLLATMLDSAMGAAVRQQLGDDEGTATVSLTVTYLRPAKVGASLEARGEVRQRGDSIVMVEGEVTDTDSGDVVAHGIATFAVISDD